MALLGGHWGAHGEACLFIPLLVLLGKPLGPWCGAEAQGSGTGTVSARMWGTALWEGKHRAHKG